MNGRNILWLATLALMAAALYRYLQAPSFWLDEAFVAVTVKDFSAAKVFAPLEYGQYFPRLYLLAIGWFKELFGYRIWSVRLLPFLCFIVATFFWAKLLLKKAGSSAILISFSAALLLGSILWLDQGIQLKQYTFDVLPALIPFLIDDAFFKKRFVEGEKIGWLLVLALPCAVAYTYPFALVARITGWYLWQGKKLGWRVPLAPASWFVVTVALCLTSIWLTDQRFNFLDRQAYLAYWQDCILRLQLQQSFNGTLRLLARFLWGWHGRMPLVTTFMVPLQIAGVYSVIKKWQSKESLEEETAWGSRTLGSMVLLAGMILASATIYYPICAGWVTLFVQAHLQVLALEGAAFIMNAGSKRVMVMVYVAMVMVAFHSGREYVRFIGAEPAENLLPALAMMQADAANKVIVSSCSVAQVRSLPDALPVAEVVFGLNAQSLRGQKVWVLWSHLGADYCADELEHFRAQAKSWQVVNDGNARGLALAEF